jgi:hypothetical protein
LPKAATIGAMQEKIAQFKEHVREISANPNFVHHKWFVQWHLEIVERIANELMERYPEANKDMVEVMVWLHDYGKILNFDDQYAETLTTGKRKLTELGFAEDFVNITIRNIETLDKKLELDMRQAPIEVQIVSSADGCAHMVGPFMHVFWHEASDQTFTGKTLEGLMELNLQKARKDWNYKIVLPEARKAFEHRYQVLCEQSGELPEKFLD